MVPQWEGDVTIYPEPASGADKLPSEAHPLQYLSAETARELAGCLGCRLPTAGEWRAAWVAEGSPSTGANLRDQSLADVRRHVAQEVQARQVLPKWPDAGAFRPGGDGDARTGNDGYVWFAPVGSDAARFHHLVGNVWEVVSVKDGLAVVGGSAFSPAALPVDEVIPVDQVSERYSDLGLRLAFDAPVQTPGEQLAAIINGQKCLPLPP